MVSVDQARSLALALPEAVEQDHHGKPSFRVGGKIFATLWDEEHMNVMVDPDGIRTAVQAEPEICAEQWWGKRLAAVRVGLARADARYAELRDRAHVLPRYPAAWHYPSSANPKRSSARGAAGRCVGAQSAEAAARAGVGCDRPSCASGVRGRSGALRR